MYDCYTERIGWVSQLPCRQEWVEGDTCIYIYIAYWYCYFLHNGCGLHIACIGNGDPQVCWQDQIRELSKATFTWFWLVWQMWESQSRCRTRRGMRWETYAKIIVASRTRDIRAKSVGRDTTHKSIFIYIMQSMQETIKILQAELARLLWDQVTYRALRRNMRFASKKLSFVVSEVIDNNVMFICPRGVWKRLLQKAWEKFHR